MTDQPSADVRPADLEHQIKELERQKREEEIKQLRAGALARWITPAALTALLPLLAGFGVWAVSELKQYNEGYRAIAERDALAEQKRELERQKVNLNQEIQTLLLLKTHHASEAERLRQDTQSKQALIDNTWLRGVFTRAEAIYSLDHVKGLEPLDAEALRAELKPLPMPLADKLSDLIERYEFSQAVIQATRAIIAEFDKALELMPNSDWTTELQPEPSGAVIGGRKIMTSQRDGRTQYYDITDGRFLSDEEAKAARP